MPNFCNQCNTEFTLPEQEVCSNCGTSRIQDDVSRPVSLQRPPTMLLRVQPKALPKTQKLYSANSETELAVPASETVENTGIILPAIPTEKVPALEELSLKTDQETSEEVMSFWQCPQCKQLNPHDAEYCEQCGAIYVSPEEQAAKARAQAEAAAKNTLPLEVLAMLADDIEDGTKPGWRFKTGSVTNEGILRRGHDNEDSIFVLELSRFYRARPESFGLYVVADGMGGQAAGEVASRNAIEGVAQIVMTELALPWMNGQNFESSEMETVLHKASLEAHTRVRDWNIANVKDSGSTLTIACLVDRQAAFANVGDSRTYLFRRGGEKRTLTSPDTNKIQLTDPVAKPSLENGRRHTDKLKFKGEVRNSELTRPQEEVEEQLLQATLLNAQPYKAIRVTRDQSLVQQLVDSGQLALDDVYDDPRRNVVLNGLGTLDEEIPVDTYSRKLETGDIILLCSDGLWEMVRDPAMAECITNLPDPQACAEELVKMACKNGGADNVSAIVVAVSN